jgi:hypothetical protein
MTAGKNIISFLRFHFTRGFVFCIFFPYCWRIKESVLNTMFHGRVDAVRAVAKGLLFEWPP